MAFIVEGICSRVSLPSLENCRFEFQSRLDSSPSLSEAPWEITFSHTA